MTLLKFAAIGERRINQICHRGVHTAVGKSGAVTILNLNQCNGR